MSQRFLPRRTRLSFPTLGALAVIAAAAALWLMSRNQASGEARTGSPEPAAKPRRCPLMRRHPQGRTPRLPQ